MKKYLVNVHNFSEKVAIAQMAERRLRSSEEPSSNPAVSGSIKILRFDGSDGRCFLSEVLSSNPIISRSIMRLCFKCYPFIKPRTGLLLVKCYDNKMVNFDFFDFYKIYSQFNK